MKRWLLIFIALILVVCGAGAGIWYWQRLPKPANFRATTIQRGDLQLTISATGTVEPEEVVDVGAQVAGQIKSLGADPRDASKTVDYTTPVDETTILARIDDTLYKSDVDQAQAALNVAQASVRRAEADLGQLKAKLDQAESDWRRAQERGKSLSEQEFDLYKANYYSAVSALDVGKASVDQAKSSVTQAQTTLDKARKNLGYCTIRSPVKGVIIDRRVNVGQTVVSSLNAPSLFLIAKDLTRMEVWVSVNEADIGQIRVGQPVSFTVDAYPNEVFRGEVGKIRLNATMTQNVVTYTVEVNTDNSSGKLLPYLTANLQFEIGERRNVLMVPNAALRWKPQPRQVAPEFRAEFGERSRKPAAQTAGGRKDAADRGTLWVKDGEFVRPLKVHVGWSDGVMTQVEGENVSEGLEVVTGEIRQNGGGSTSNPFTPRLFNSGNGAKPQ
jgi:HlyD family secretion protein